MTYYETANPPSCHKTIKQLSLYEKRSLNYDQMYVTHDNSFLQRATGK